MDDDSIEYGNEETVVEIINNITEQRVNAWNKIFETYGVSQNQNKTILTSRIEEDPSLLELDDTPESDSDDEEDVPSVLEMTKQWVAICSRMDTTNSCHVCSVQGNISLLQTQHKTSDVGVPPDNHGEVVEDDRKNSDEVNKSSDDKKFDVDNNITQIPESDIAAALPGFDCDGSEGTSITIELESSTDYDGIMKIRDIPHVVTLHGKVCKSERRLIREYMEEKSSQFTEREIGSLVIYIEELVGNELKDLGLLLNSVECQNDPELQDRVKKRFVPLISYLAIHISVTAICLYGFYQRWKHDRHVTSSTEESQ